ncbi:MAG: restriction endonuclease subunit S [Candidatus Merdivicinus sp.]|uniref:restriction endonuclease subunit S n=1 Tax=Hominenteromicrobium sp. TaxID=3073581 RepID=UPI003A91E554
MADLVPFEIPSSWEWCRVGDLFSNMSGLAYKKDALAIKADKMIRVLRGGNIGEEQFLFKGDDVFISSELVKPELYLRKNYMITPAVSSLDHIGKIALIDKDYSDTVVGGFVLMLIPHFNDDVVSEYLLYAFAAKHHRDNCRNITHKSGQAFYNLSREQMMNLPVPIPPREEMGRIIAMLKRVLPKVADYAVVDTALQNLNGSFPEALKKSILQEAVQGKLVPQDPSDEPAEALLERIREEKQRLIKEGKIKKDKHESVIFRRDNSHYEKRGSEDVCIDEEVPFEIPENWAWARLSSFGVFSSGKTPSMSNPQFWNGNVPWVTSKDMKRPVITDSEMHISELAASTMQLYPAGTLLLVARSGILKRLLPLCKLGIDSTINQDIKAFSLYDIELSEWLFYGIKAFEPYILKELVKSVTTVESLKFDEFAAMMIPVPPLSEQRRIIAAIKAAMKLLTPMSSNPLFSL